MTKEIKNIIKLTISAIFVAFAVCGVIHCLTFNKAMEQVRQEIIEDAVLVSVDGNGYTISFAGELHSYTFD